MTLFESIFIFDEKYYKQCHGVAAGSLLDDTFLLFGSTEHVSEIEKNSSVISRY